MRLLGVWLLTFAKNLDSEMAVAFTLACATHPGFVFLTKVDLGPIALMLFFKAFCLYLWLRWLQTSCFFVVFCWSDCRLRSRFLRQI